MKLKKQDLVDFRAAIIGEMKEIAAIPHTFGNSAAYIVGERRMVWLIDQLVAVTKLIALYEYRED